MKYFFKIATYKLDEIPLKPVWKNKTLSVMYGEKKINIE